jgi:hypothetical protein
LTEFVSLTKDGINIDQFRLDEAIASGKISEKDA